MQSSREQQGERDKKAFLSEQCKKKRKKKKKEENNSMGKTTFSLRKLEIPKEHFMQRWAK